MIEFRNILSPLSDFQVLISVVFVQRTIWPKTRSLSFSQLTLLWLVLTPRKSSLEILSRIKFSVLFGTLLVSAMWQLMKRPLQRKVAVRN